MIRNDTSGMLICPVTGLGLHEVGDSQVWTERISKDVIDKYVEWNLPWDSLTGWLVNDNETIGYPIVSDIPICVADFSVMRDDSGRYKNDLDQPVLNPFTYYLHTNVEYYRLYANTVEFKLKFFMDCLRQEDRIIVEFLSSEGLALSGIKKTLGDFWGDYAFIAVDLDFGALLRAKRSGLVGVCADVGKRLFKNGSIDFAFSNSMHHVPEQAAELLHRIYWYLKIGGRFAGVEAEGPLARLALSVVRCWPKRLMPYLMLEIYEERNLLQKWLSSPVIDRLKDAAIQKFDVKHRGPHVLYKFDKVPGNQNNPS